MRSDKEFVDDVYKGDWKKYEADLAEGRKHALSWNDIAAFGKVLPELAEQANKLMTEYLGYEVHHSISIPHEPFIRVVIQNHCSGLINDKEFEEQLTIHAKNIRNEDMEKGSWLTEYDITEEIKYLSEHVYYKDIARERLVKFLGYEPDLQSSSTAERMLRQTFIDEPFDLHWDIQPIDFKVLTITKYREVYFKSGKEAADNSPLVKNTI